MYKKTTGKQCFILALRDYETLPLLPSYTRVTVEGTVDSVREKILNIFNNLH